MNIFKNSVRLWHLQSLNSCRRINPESTPVTEDRRSRHLWPCVGAQRLQQWQCSGNPGWGWPPSATEPLDTCRCAKNRGWVGNRDPAAGRREQDKQRHPALLLVYLYLRGPLGSTCRHRCVGCMQQNERHILGQACALLSQKSIAIKAK